MPCRFCHRIVGSALHWRNFSHRELKRRAFVCCYCLFSFAPLFLCLSLCLFCCFFYCFFDWFSICLLASYLFLWLFALRIAHLLFLRLSRNTCFHWNTQEDIHAARAEQMDCPSHLIYISFTYLLVVPFCQNCLPMISKAVCPLCQSSLHQMMLITYNESVMVCERERLCRQQAHKWFFCSDCHSLNYLCITGVRCNSGTVYQTCVSLVASFIVLRPHRSSSSIWSSGWGSADFRDWFLFRLSISSFVQICLQWASS